MHDHSIVAWTVSDTKTRELVTSTINRVMGDNNIDSKGLILHTDQGSVYTSLEFNKTLDGYGIRHSMSRTGIPGDNSPMESFWSHLKDEDLNFDKTLTKEELIQNITEAIDWYNVRSH